MSRLLLVTALCALGQTWATQPSQEIAKLQKQFPSSKQAIEHTAEFKKLAAHVTRRKAMLAKKQHDKKAHKEHQKKGTDKKKKPAAKASSKATSGDFSNDDFMSTMDDFSLDDDFSYSFDDDFSFGYDDDFSFGYDDDFSFYSNDDDFSFGYDDDFSFGYDDDFSFGYDDDFTFGWDDDFSFNYDDFYFTDDIANNDDHGTSPSAYGYANMQYYDNGYCNGTKTYGSGVLANTCQIVNGHGYSFSYKIQFDDGESHCLICSFLWFG